MLSGDPDHLQVLQSLETVLLHGKKADIPLVILEAKNGTLESALFVLLQTATLQILYLGTLVAVVQIAPASDRCCHQ